LKSAGWTTLGDAEHREDFSTVIMPGEHSYSKNIPFSIATLHIRNFFCFLF
jgi:hypothetical protein